MNLQIMLDVSILVCHILIMCAVLCSNRIFNGVTGSEHLVYISKLPIRVGLICGVVASIVAVFTQHV